MSSTEDLRQRVGNAIRDYLKATTLPPLTIFGSQASPGIGASEYDIADVAITAIQGAYVPPPPGSDRNALPDDLRALVAPHMTGYLSTACETASACKFAAEDNPDRSDELRQWEQREHAACRQTRKQDMARCTCPCHRATP